MKKTGALLFAGLVALLLTFQPAAPRAARAQDSGTPAPSYIDALGTQAALNTQATLAAYQQQQDAAGANNNASAAYAAYQQAQAQAAYVAQQATAQAGQQQAALAAAQSTADAAALQATAIVQQTRTALELEVTRQAASVAAETTRQAVVAEATRAAITADMTRTSADAQRRDNEAIATSVAGSIEATQVAIEVEQRATGERQADERRVAEAGTLAVTIVIGVGGLVTVLLIGKFALGLWRSRALNPQPGPAAPLPVTPRASSASAAVVDAATGDVSARFAIIEYDDDPAALEKALRSLYGK